MSKKIAPNELGELVSTLLVNPALLGELDEHAAYLRFFEAIGEVVADFCGGVVNGVSSENVNPGAITSYESPLLSVSPSDSLPSLHRCVWSYHDDCGWEDEQAEDYDIIEGKEFTLNEVKVMRRKMQASLLTTQLVTTDSVIFQAKCTEILNGPDTVNAIQGALRVAQNHHEEYRSMVHFQDGSPHFSKDGIDRFCESLVSID